MNDIKGQEVKVGDKVLVRGCLSEQELNGSLGIICSTDNRIVVKLYQTSTAYKNKYKKESSKLKWLMTSNLLLVIPKAINKPKDIKMFIALAISSSGEHFDV